jgi:hypothetical protein
MAFKPKKTYTPREDGDFEYRDLPTPKEGARKGRVSLIIDLGTQNREDYVNEQTGEKRPQKPSQQVAVFVDLTADKVDYGGDIGVQPYRLALNKTFKGKFEGINFKALPPMDKDGKKIEGAKWALPGASILSKLCKAVGKGNVAVDDRNDPESLDLEVLLNRPVMVTVEVKVTEKELDDGTTRTYKNVNVKGLSPVPTVEDDDGNEQPIPVPALSVEPKCITFDNAKKDDIKFIRKNILKIIKQANDYEGSAMQAAVEAYEAEQAEASESKPASPAPASAASKSATKNVAAKKPLKPAAPADESEPDAPF